MGVEDLLQKHSLVEADINVLGERVKGVVQQSQRFLDQEATEGYRPCDPAMIIERVQQLEVNNPHYILLIFVANSIIIIFLLISGCVFRIGEIGCRSSM